MFNFVLQKIRSAGSCKSLALVLPVIILLLGCLLTIMVAKKDNAVTNEQRQNKLNSLASQLTTSIWKGLRPKPMEEPKYTYIQRFWNYFN